MNNINDDEAERITDTNSVFLTGVVSRERLSQYENTIAVHNFELKTKRLTIEVVVRNEQLDYVCYRLRLNQNVSVSGFLRQICRYNHEGKQEKKNIVVADDIKILESNEDNTLLSSNKNNSFEIIITGTLINDFSLVNLYNTTTCKFQIKNQRHINIDSDWKDETYYFDVELSGSRVEEMQKHLVKEQKIAVKGWLSGNSWEHYSSEISKKKIMEKRR